jgi:hypothetical protein
MENQPKKRTSVNVDAALWQAFQAWSDREMMHNSRAMESVMAAAVMGQISGDTCRKCLRTWLEGKRL